MSSRRGSSGGMGGAFAILVAVGFVVKFWWLILLVLAIGAVGFGMWWVVTRLDAQDDRRHRERRAVAARADQQHGWTLNGDDRGTYGDYSPDPNGVGQQWL